MTTAPQPLGRLDAVLEHVIRGIAWVIQVAAVVTYLIVTARSPAWLPLLGKYPASTLCVLLFAVCMAGLWMVSLWGEQGRFYDRTTQRSHRRAGLLGHFSVLFIAGVSVLESPERAGWWIILGLLCFSAVTTWGAWAQTKFLPDEDQAVVDAILSREAAQRAAIFDASQREQRRERLAAVVASLGYTLTDTPAQPSKPADAPVVKWTVPAGKHAPYVYFIRNGNRMKIGTTTELKRRIRTLALRAENIALLFDGGQRREHEFHKQFAEHRIGTTEWFADEGALADFVRDQTVRVFREEQSK